MQRPWGHRLGVSEEQQAGWRGSRRWESEGERSEGCCSIRLCRTLKPWVRTLVATTEKLEAQASLRPGDTSLCYLCKHCHRHQAMHL